MNIIAPHPSGIFPADGSIGQFLIVSERASNPQTVSLGFITPPNRSPSITSGLFFNPRNKRCPVLLLPVFKSTVGVIDECNPPPSIRHIISFDDLNHG